MFFIYSIFVLSLQLAQALSCQLLVITEQEFIEENFVASSTSQGHDVPEMTVKGAAHEVTAMADGKWLGLNWRKHGEMLAESISLLRDVTGQPRVLLVYNPQNTEEQISINCAD
jgi:hypothetical protein